MQQLIKAIRYAEEKHRGQFRKFQSSQVPYITHPLRVAERVLQYFAVEWCDCECSAAVLHDVIEDCGVTAEDLKKEGFRPWTIQLVQELTNPSKGSTASRAERKKIDRDHIAKISKESKIIKMFDRIDNLNEIDEAEPKWIKKYCEESTMLVEVLRGADDHLLHELESTIQKTLNKVHEKELRLKALAEMTKIAQENGEYE